jgi:hypothetical protein
MSWSSEKVVVAISATILVSGSVCTNVAGTEENIPQRLKPQIQSALLWHG